MYLLREPVPDYLTRWDAFDESARWMELSPADRHFAWREHTEDEELARVAGADRPLRARPVLHRHRRR